MELAQIVQSATLLLVLLNPFLLVIYLLSLVQRLRLREFAGVMARAALFSGIVFGVFAWAGDVIFRDVLQIRFAAFLVFGGLAFLVVAMRFMFQGPAALANMRGEAPLAASSVAMPFMIGAGTLQASVLAGSRQPLPYALVAIASALLITVVTVTLMKALHDYVHERNEALVARYVDLCGRASALVIGAMAIDMIFQGLEQWIRLASFVVPSG